MGNFILEIHCGFFKWKTIKYNKYNKKDKEKDLLPSSALT